jgi:hypothetical protein
MGGGGRAGGLGRALTDVLDASLTTATRRHAVFAVPDGAGAVEERMTKALDALAAAFPGDVVAWGWTPDRGGLVVRVRSADRLSPGDALSLPTVIAGASPSPDVARARVGGTDGKPVLAVWRPRGVLGDGDRRLVDALAALAGG